MDHKHVKNKHGSCDLWSPGGIKSHISVVHLSDEEPARSKRLILCKKNKNKCWCFWSFGVVDFTFKICFYLFFSRAPIWDRCAYCCLPYGLQALMLSITFKLLHRQWFYFIRPQYISPAAIGTNFVFPVPAFWTLKLTAPTDLYFINYQGTWIHMKMLVCFIGWLTGV